MRQGGGTMRRAAIAMALLAAASGVAQAQDAATERRQAFVLADVNGDGCLQLAEVAREMAWRFAALDTDHDQKLARDELVIADDARFVRIDRDGDGKLSFLEVMELKQADLAKADHTGRGCVLVDEVTAFDGAAPMSAAAADRRPRGPARGAGPAASRAATKATA